MYLTVSEILERLDKAAELVQPIGSALWRLKRDPQLADMLHSQILELAQGIEEEQRRYSDEQDKWEAQNFQ